MAINRKELIERHNPVLSAPDFRSPMTVGNGEFAYTADITGLQTLYEDYRENGTPLCTMSHWGWHITPVDEKQYAYTLDDVMMTQYDYGNRQVTYAVEEKKGNEDVYHWLRENPHRLNLGRIGLRFDNQRIKKEAITEIYQKLNVYEGVLESNFKVFGVGCRVITTVHSEIDAVAFSIESEALKEGHLSVSIEFPYGSKDITGSIWESDEAHETIMKKKMAHGLILEHRIDKNNVWIGIEGDANTRVKTVGRHGVDLSTNRSKMEATVGFASSEISKIPDFKSCLEMSMKRWESYWQEGGVVDLHRSKDSRAIELERRIVLSQYLTGVQSCGSLPPQETGLICNSWFGKFHLEMYLWHCAFFPLWNRTYCITQSLDWYRRILPKAKINAERNGFKGAKWPKQVAYDGIDSPSHIATLLIWQQPHIIYMLELAYQSTKDETLLRTYWEVIRETAEYMIDYVQLNPLTNRYDLPSPIIPAQEEHNPKITVNPTFEVEYWRFTLNLAGAWAKRIQKEGFVYEEVAKRMAELPVKDGRYLAHQNCPTTFDAFNRDHPSMVGIYGLIPCDRIHEEYMKNTLDKIYESWDFESMWGWDFAMMAMTEVRLGNKERAIEILLKDTMKNEYVVSGNNYQRKNLPLYLPGNGSLLLAIPMFTAGYKGCNEKLPGFPDNGMWEVEFEDIEAFPY